MDQPVFWSILLGVSVLAVVARLWAGGPLVRRRSVPLGRAELAVAGASGLALVFHCTAMFFGPWVDAIPGAQGPGDAVRALGTASQWSYWLAIVALLVALRQIWWPALALLAGAMLGVGATMFSPYPLTTHLAWITAAVLGMVFVSSSLVHLAGPERMRRPDQVDAHAS